MIKCQTHIGSSLQDVAQIGAAITTTTYTRLFESCDRIVPVDIYVLRRTPTTLWNTPVAKED